MVKYNEGLLQGIMAEYVVKKLKLAHYFVNLYSFYNNTNELDFVYIDKNGYSVEYELKSALNDFRDDFRLKIEKHQLLKSRDESCPNRFYFVAPEGVMPEEEIPDYCGILHVVRNKYGEHTIKTIRRAPLLHDKKVTLESFFQKVYYQLAKFQAVWFGDKKKKFNASLKKEGLVEKKPPKTKKVSRRSTGRRTVRKRRRSTRKK